MATANDITIDEGSSQDMTVSNTMMYTQRENERRSTLKTAS